MKVSELLNKSSKWTTRAFGRNLNDRSCAINDEDCVKWCLVGAIDRCYPQSTKSNPIVKKLGKAIVGRELPTIADYLAEIVRFNDNANFNQIKSLLQQVDE